MSFQEYVDWLHDGAVDLCDLSEDDVAMLQEEYDMLAKEGLLVKKNGNVE